MTISIQDFVKREVIYCVSALIHNLTDYETCPVFAEQAQELCQGKSDYESAARAHGWYVNDKENFETVTGTDIPDEITSFGPTDPDGGWSTLCEAEGIEPHIAEIHEHWIVSEQLARKLQAKGERVSLDFQGLTIWGRSQNDQEIFMDDVIQDIYSEMVSVSQ